MYSLLLRKLMYLPGLWRARKTAKVARKRIEHLLHMRWLERMRLARIEQAHDPRIAETVRLYRAHVNGH